MSRGQALALADTPLCFHVTSITLPGRSGKFGFQPGLRADKPTPFPRCDDSWRLVDCPACPFTPIALDGQFFPTS